MMRRWTAAAALTTALWTQVAFACPACAGRDNENPARTTVFLGAMILLPWTVSAAVIVSLRKLQQENENTNNGDVNEP